MRLTIALLTLTIVAVAFAQDPLCELDMDQKKCNAEEIFAHCQSASLSRTNCVCPSGTKCRLQDNDGACTFFCESVGDNSEDNNAGMDPGNGMA